MITISPTFQWFLKVEADVYLDAATAYADTAIPGAHPLPTQSDGSAGADGVFMGQHYLSFPPPASPNPEFGVGIYIIGYDLSFYKFEDILSTILKFNTKYYSITNNEQDKANLQVRIFRKYYYIGTPSSNNAFKSNQWPNPNAGDAYELLDEVELENSIYEGGKFDFVHEIPFVLKREHLENSKIASSDTLIDGQVLWILLNEKDHFDLVDPSTLTGGIFYYKSTGFEEMPLLEITIPVEFSATIKAVPAVEATLANQVAEPALLFTQPIERSIYFDSSTVGYASYEPLQGIGEANYLTPVVPSKRLVPHGVLKPSQKEAI